MEQYSDERNNFIVIYLLHDYNFQRGNCFSIKRDHSPRSPKTWKNLK